MEIDQASRADPAKPSEQSPSGQSIAEVTKRFGVSARTLRSYESHGLIHPRREGMRWIYDATAIASLDLILKAERLGFTLAEIRAMLAGLSQASVAERRSTVAVEQVTRKARETFGTDEKAQQWLHRPTTALSDLSPMDMMFAGVSGVRKVVDLLNRIDHGLSV